ncbi:hypothetical protein P8452_36314 [Trifolium repens]|nr:hypothetical protein P8452_36314 [Trifolium repens]
MDNGIMRNLITVRIRKRKISVEKQNSQDNKIDSEGESLQGFHYSTLHGGEKHSGGPARRSGAGGGGESGFRVRVLRRVVQWNERGFREVFPFICFVLVLI